MPDSTESPPRVPSFACHIAGVPHRRPDYSLFKIGDVVNLVHEPQNQYDPNAIMVEFRYDAQVGEVTLAKRLHLGYIPKLLTGEVHKLGLTEMQIVSITPDNKWKEIVIEA